MKLILRKILCLLLVTFIHLTAMAESVLIRNAALITQTADGSLAGTDILIQDGVITALGKNLDAPGGSLEIDAQHHVVTPGFFNSDTVLGVVEVQLIESTRDFTTTNHQVTAALRVADAVNPHSVLLPHNRILGLTHALVMPRSGSGLFAGQAAIVQLGGGDDTVVNPSVAMVVELGEAGQQWAGGSRAAAMALLRQALRDARDYGANVNAFNSGNRRAYTLSLLDLQALLPVVRGEKPLIARVERAADIQSVLALGAEFSLNLILAGVTEGWRVADELATANVPVIVDPINNIPMRYEMLGARLDNAALMHEAGVRLMFTGMGGDAGMHNPHLVRQSAGNAVANGLPRDVAIAAMTRVPAEVFGLHTGQLAVGREGSLVVWDGDPLEVTSSVTAVVIRGENLPLVSRSTRLRDRYFSRLKALKP